MRTIAVVGLGYVGLPVALAFARRFPGTLGYDRRRERIVDLRAGRDETGQVGAEELARTSLELAEDPGELRRCDFFVVTVPTPVDREKRPDLSALEEAARLVGGALAPGDVVVFESTVYPGVTEEVCGPLLAAASGLECGVDFKLAYSPERIAPGDPERTFERVPKVVSAQDAETLALVAACYGEVVEAGVHPAPSIRVAEAAKVTETVQRDLNVALMNELAILFERLGLDTRAVIETAATKWNFHPYRPGLVGGHCIGVDPYYLTAKAQQVGIHPQVILAGRRINDGMASFVASKTIRLLARSGRAAGGARAAVLGLAFKPGVADVRNSQVPGIVRELRDHGLEVRVHDPQVDPRVAAAEHGIETVEREALGAADVVVLAVGHRGLDALALELARGGARVLVDVAWALDGSELPAGVEYWRL